MNAVNSELMHYLDTVGVIGSSPIPRTILTGYIVKKIKH